WINGPNLSGILISAVIARLLAGVVLAWFCHREITAGQPTGFDRGEAIELLKYGGWVNMTSVIGPILFMTDRFLIGGVLGAKAVTDYTVPFQLANRTAILPGSLVTALFPRLSAVGPEEQEHLSQVATLAVVCLLSPLFVGGIFIMGPFLTAWVGGQVSPVSLVVGRVLLLAMWANALGLVAFTRLQASGRPDTVSKIMLAEIPPYLLLLGGGAYLAGLLGCAVVTAIRSVIDTLLLTWFANRRIPAWRLVAAELAIVCLAVWLAGLWTISDWRWWAASATLVSLSAVIAGVSAPAELRERIVQRLPVLRLRPR
ncbi:MAG TPA: oligosaccharide flippase family protein, partial [Caulobacteraceae bacterium]|nr:oligosaccharide flippase family protein [Caulobacteraceae bacterium]